LKGEIFDLRNTRRHWDWNLLFNSFLFGWFYLEVLIGSRINLNDKEIKTKETGNFLGIHYYLFKNLK
jgi:hypothetical protein